MELPVDPALPLIGLYLKNSKTQIWKNICTPVFITALVTTAKTYRSKLGPSIDAWIKKM